ncbi:hypothetical protein Pfo_021262 [Paulownia fortunei]|nr:hypothetical protein Pfo_021262 [Paulownia fortunei]
MLIKIGHISDYSTWTAPQHVKPHHRSQTLLHNPSSNLPIFNLKEKQGFKTLSSFSILQKYDKNRRSKRVVDFRNYVVCSGVEQPSGPPPNILSWIAAVAIAVVIPFINYKWGPLLKNKIETAMKMTEDVVEAVEKVAGEVEKVAEDIADDLPEGSKLRKAVDFVERLAERAAKDAGAVDDFIDKVQEEEEKAESVVESLKNGPKDPPKESNDETEIKSENPK